MHCVGPVWSFPVVRRALYRKDRGSASNSEKKRKSLEAEWQLSRYLAEPTGLVGVLERRDHARNRRSAI